jgi:hypothetical protein
MWAFLEEYEINMCPKEIIAWIMNILNYADDDDDDDDGNDDDHHHPSRVRP